MGILLVAFIAGTTCQGRSPAGGGGPVIIAGSTSQPTTADLTGRWKVTFVGESSRTTILCLTIDRLKLLAVEDACVDALPGVTDLAIQIDGDDPVIAAITFTVPVLPAGTVATTLRATQQSPDQFSLEVRDLRQGDGQLTTYGGPYPGSMVRQ